MVGTSAIICMPTDAPALKVEATRGYGAEIVFYDRLKDDRAAVARRLADETGRVLVPPYDDLAIMAGQGTAALELFEEVPALDALVTPVGGGGLMAGCSTVARSLSPRHHGRWRRGRHRERYVPVAPEGRARDHSPAAHDRRRIRPQSPGS